MSTPNRDPGSFHSTEEGQNQNPEVFGKVLATINRLIAELHPGSTVAEVGPDTRLDMTLGLDSLAFLELRDRLEQEFTIVIPDSLFVEGLTARDWFRAIATGPLATVVKDEQSSPTLSANTNNNHDVAEEILAPTNRQTARVFAATVARENSASVGQRIFFLIYGAYAMTIAVVVAGFSWPFIALAPLPQRWRYGFARRAGSLLRRLIGIRLSVVGSLPEHGPMMVVANHASFIDGLVLIVALREPMTFLVGSLFERQFLVGRLLSGLGSIFVTSGPGANATLLNEQFVEILQAGHSIASFPEGHLEQAPRLTNFYMGSFRAAAEAGVRIVPVGISGTRAIVAPGTRLPRPGNVRVEIGSPIDPSAADWQSLIEFRNTARNAISLLSGTPL